MACFLFAQPLVLDLYSMCTKYSPHRLLVPRRGGGGSGAVVEAADRVRSDVESGGSVNPKALFHLYDVSLPYLWQAVIRLALLRLPIRPLWHKNYWPLQRSSQANPPVQPMGAKCSRLRQCVCDCADLAKAAAWISSCRRHHLMCRAAAMQEHF